MVVGRGGGAAGKCRNDLWVRESFWKHRRGFFWGQQAEDEFSVGQICSCRSQAVGCCRVDVALFPPLSFETQRNGLVFIYDMAGSQYTNFELDLSKKILNLLKVTAGGDPVSGDVTRASRSPST